MTVIGLVVPPDLPSDQFIRYVTRAEQLGFAELWVVEDCFLSGGLTQAAVALAATSTIHVGVGILPAAVHHAAFTAMDVATLARLFPGRITIGIGHGMPAWIRQVGAWPASPLTLFREFVPILRRILAGERVSFAGQYIRLDGVELGEPPSVAPRLVAGVRGPKSIALAAAIADGLLLAEPLTPEYLRTVTEQVGAISDFSLIGYAVAAVDEDADRARSIARLGLRWVGDPDWAPHIAPLPFVEEFRRLRETVTDRDAFAAALPDEWVNQLAVTGTPEDARKRLDQLGRAGLDRVALIPAGPNPLNSLETLATLL